MLNRGMLLKPATGASGTIGKAGQEGFGVGVFDGPASSLAAMGLSEMDGCRTVGSDNYGNYVHTNGSIMCYIPAFCYRLGNSSAPSYSRDWSNALEIMDANQFEQFEPGATFSSANFGNGWILHRAFVDGNIVQRGFFMDKYLCSRSGTNAVSVKNADRVMCYDTSAAYTTKSMGGDGCGYDAITFSRNRGDYYSLTTVYQWSAMAMLSLAHGQAATSSEFCAWYDSGHTTNFPKGATNSGCTDADDPTISYSAHSYGSTFAKTGSGTPFNKVTHNGQACGIADVAGMCNQWLIGAINPSTRVVGLMKITVKAHDFTKSNRTSASLHDSFSIEAYYGTYFDRLFPDNSGINWSKCGVIPKTGLPLGLFGDDEWVEEGRSPDTGLMVGLGHSWGTNAGVFCRSFRGGYYSSNGRYWGQSSYYFGFRAAGYAP